MIGDVLTSSILFEALKKKYPHAELHYLIYKHTLPVVENNPYVDKFLLFDPEKDQSLKGFVKFLKQIRYNEYDVVIDVYAKINSALFNIFSGAETKISYHKWYTKKAYTQTFRPKEALETVAGFAIENRMHLLSGLSSEFPAEIKPKIYLTSEEKKAAQERLKKEGISFEKPLIMCGILGSSTSKTYPLPYMAQILDFIVERSGAQLLFNYIPKQEKEARKLLELCKAKTRNHVFFDIFGKSLREFMAITYHCDALIGNEGGAVNMAKALEVPTFSIFSPPIKKENWSSYEDSIKNVSVHLKDYHPEKFEDTPNKKLHKLNQDLYKAFEPRLIQKKLDQFLKSVL